MGELKACPFCGHMHPIVFRDQADRGFGITCGHCSATVGGYSNTANNAIKEWNRRSGPSPFVGRRIREIEEDPNHAP